MEDLLYSFVIPCYNSSQTIKKVVEDTVDEMKKMNRENIEFVLVNDCSPDGGKTANAIKSLSCEYPFVKAIDLAKNVGQHNAIMAGLNFSAGDVIIGMDDDGQTSPTQLGTMFDEFFKGTDIVYGFYPQKKHSAVRNLASYLNYLSVRILIKKPKWLKTSSFWIIKKFVRDAVIEYKNSYSYLQGLFLRTTKNIKSVPIKHFERECGKSGYTFKSLFRLWSSIIGFSVVPLRISTYLGYIFAGCGFIGGIVTFIKKLLNPNMAVGWPSMMVAIFIFSGIILLFMGLLGEYIGRMFLAQNNEPQYVVREKYNIK